MYDVIIIGAGPAGLTAAAYSARSMLKTLVIERYPLSGGQMLLTDVIANFPAYAPSDGSEIAKNLKAQAEEAGAEFISAEVTRIADGKPKTVFAGGKEYQAKTLIIACGAEHKKLGVPGEDKFAGRGVSYCAVCDGGFFRGKDIAVIGGGDTALKDALYLSAICRKVYLIHRRESFRGSADKLSKCEQTDNIEIIRSAVCREICGESSVTGIVIEQNGERRRIECSGVFAAVGMAPSTELVKDIVKLDEKGCIEAGEDCVTSAEGIFAAGDIRTKPLRQIVTACSDGANAASSAKNYILSE